MYQILHLSDLHYRQRYPETGADYYDTLRAGLSFDEKLSRVSGAVRGRNLAGVLISGDICEYGSVSDYRRVRKKLQNAFPGVKIGITPGNHDGKGQLRQGWLGGEASTDPYNHSEDFGEFRLISLDGSREGLNTGEISRDQCRYLEAELKNAGGKPVILLSHFHLLDCQHFIPKCGYPAEFERILRESSITAILTGHTHRVYSGFFCGIPYYASPSMSFYDRENKAGVMEYPSGYGYSVYTLEGNAVKSTETYFYY